MQVGGRKMHGSKLDPNSFRRLFLLRITNLLRSTNDHHRARVFQYKGPVQTPLIHTLLESLKTNVSSNPESSRCGHPE